MNEALFSNPFNLLNIKNTFERISKTNINLTTNHFSPYDRLEKLANDDKMLMLLADINLTFYTGFLFYPLKRSTQIFIL